MFWVGYLIGAALALLALRAIYVRVIEPFPGLRPIGRAGFRWAAAMAVLIALVSALFPGGPNQSTAASCVMRGVCVLEFCLAGFVLLSMQALRFSWKRREFGIALGLAMIAAAELAASVVALRHSTTALVVNDGSQIATALAAVAWAAWFVRPAAETSARRSGEPSMLDRLNEVAAALAEPAPQVSLGVATSGFFLDDVVKVVDRVMERNAASPGE